MSCLKAERRPSPRTQSLSPPQNQTVSAGAQELVGPEMYKYHLQTKALYTFILTVNVLCEVIH